jgi:hypothetical protein
MKIVLIFMALVIFSVAALGNSIAVSPLKTVPKEVKSFANDLYAEVVADKKLIQLFLREGERKEQLSEGEREYDAAHSIANPRETGADGSESASFLLHGCNGVFTDAEGTVFFWRLSSPRILDIISQKRQTAFLILKEEHLELLHGYSKKG